MPPRTRRAGAMAPRLIGAALLAGAQGEGHRTIAARLDRPAATVRGWLRAFARRSEPLQACAVRWTISLGDGAALPRRWSGRPVADALDGVRGAGVGAASRPRRQLAVGADRRAEWRRGVLHGRIARPARLLSHADGDPAAGCRAVQSG